MTKVVQISMPVTIAPAAIAQAAVVHAVSHVDSLSADGVSLSTNILIAGEPCRLTVSFSPGRLIATCEGVMKGHSETDVRRMLGNWFDTEADVDVIRAHLADDLRLSLGSPASLRILRFPDVFRGMVVTVLGQQVGQQAARRRVNQLVVGLGSQAEIGWLFPTAARLAAVPSTALAKMLGITASRAEALRRISQLFVDDPIWWAGTDYAALRRRLLSQYGVGPWTTEYILLRVLNDPDAFPATDRVLQRILGTTDLREATRLAARWSPWRSYAVFSLWREALVTERHGSLATPLVLPRS